MTRERCASHSMSRALATVIGATLASAACSSDGGDVALGTSIRDVTSGEVTSLPEPELRRSPRLELTADQAARQREVDDFIVSTYKARGYRIVKTTQTYSGDIWDWLDPDSVPGSRVEPPPDNLALPPEPSTTSRDQHQALTEFDVYPEVRGPEDTVPMYRESFREYVEGTTGYKSLREFLSNAPSGQPAGRFRLYGGYRISESTPISGVHSEMQQFTGSVEASSFNILETTLGCGFGGSNLQAVAMVVGRGFGGDSGGDGVKLRLWTEFFTNGNNTGNFIGGRSPTPNAGFIHYSGAPYGPGVELTIISNIGGPTDAWSPVDMILSGGNYWLKHNNNWLGYYPASLFTGKSLSCDMTSQSNSAQWYGEVYDPSPGSWTQTNMGSGWYASAGALYASYHWRPWVVNTSGTSLWPDGLSGFTALATILGNPVDPACYTTGGMNTSGDRFFFLGGAGHTTYNGCN